MSQHVKDVNVSPLLNLLTRYQHFWLEFKQTWTKNLDKGRGPWWWSSFSMYRVQQEFKWSFEPKRFHTPRSHRGIWEDSPTQLLSPKKHSTFLNVILNISCPLHAFSPHSRIEGLNRNLQHHHLPQRLGSDLPHLFGRWETSPHLFFGRHFQGGGKIL